MTRADALQLGALGLTVALVLAFGPSLATIGAPALLFALLVADGVFRPASALLLPVHLRAPGAEKQVALTFDDGPDPEVTPKVLDALSAAGARATFFVIGRHAEAHPDLVRRMIAEGHQVANHSFDHARTLNFASARRMQEEIEAGGRAVANVTGQAEPRWYRPPVGLKSPPLARAAKRLGLEVVMWSVHGRDTRGATPDAIAHRVLAAARPGAIVLLHDGHDRGGPARAATAEALPAILRGLAERGLEPVTIERLFAGGSIASPRGQTSKTSRAR